MKRVLILGAGASGLTAAVSAASQGASVTVIDHQDEAGTKLALTGNGKCNYTNTEVSPAHYHCADRGFVMCVLRLFSYEDCIGFFAGMGIEPDIRHYAYDDSGYVYPKGMDAAGFRDVLVSRAKELGVSFVFGVAGEQAVRIDEDGGIGLSLNNGNPERYDALIIAAGSNAYPSTGSDSSVYPLLKRLGLTFHTFLPALCGLYSRDPLLKEMKGQRIRDEVRLEITDRDAGGGPDGQDGDYSCYGEVQFGEHYLSGIPVMQLSRYASGALKQGKRVLLHTAGHGFEIYRTAGFDRAQVCTGGVDVSEIHPLTMECKKLPGVYICGELLDADGDCGGFNLHFAWATGYLAGKNAAAESSGENGCGCLDDIS